MHSSRFIQRLFALLAGASLSAAAWTANAEPISRADVLEIARSYAEHRWHSSAKNVLHGPDHDRVEVSTPDRTVPGEENNTALWQVDSDNVGMPYKWGGFDTLQTFDAGIRKGKAAGDLYSWEKRKKGGAAVSGEAVGVDCSGFISRCWKLKEKQGTSTLESLCLKLDSPVDLLPGDVMNSAEGHVVLFVKWLDDGKSRALFYESEPFSKVIASEHDIATLVAEHFHPLRYRQIHD